MREISILSICCGCGLFALFILRTSSMLKNVTEANKVMLNAVNNQLDVITKLVEILTRKVE